MSAQCLRCNSTDNAFLQGDYVCIDCRTIEDTAINDRQFIRQAAIEAMNANIIGVLVNAKDVKNDTKYLENVALKSAVEFAQLLLIEVKRYEIEIKKHKRECK